MTSISKLNKKISEKGDQLEASLSKKLRKFYLEKIKPFATRYPPETLRQLHEDAIFQIIRKAVQESYQFGTEVVSEQMRSQNPDFELFVSGQDINEIKTLTNSLVESFWQTTSRLILRESEFKQSQGIVEKKPEFDIQGAMLGISSAIAFQSINQAVRSKLTALSTSPPPLPTPPKTTIVHGNEGIDVEIELPFEIKRLGEEGTKNRIMFLTKEDSKVDPEICAPLNRNVYDVDDPLTPEPPMHPHCRCRLVPVVE
jgi:hypothetical protein